MVADEISKEEAAKFVKKLQDDDSASAAMRNATANIVQTVFTSLEDAEFNDISLDDGEADELLSEPFDAEEDFGLGQK